MASSYTTYDVYVRPSDIKNSREVARVLALVLQLDYEKVLEKVEKKTFSEVRIASDIEQKQVPVSVHADCMLQGLMPGPLLR